ncbi:SrfA family protein [Pseudomonas sp. SDO528_S397]
MLRSGQRSAFTALGETGQPVYRAALQLREAIRRQDPELVKHLAIPQSDEQGNQIDWYSSVDGDVIPWSSATEAERAPARQQLEALKTALKDLSQRFIGPEGQAQTGDKVVFGKLLKRAIHFPDETFVYLVNGKPVLTFWGFEHPDAPPGRDPLLCLYPPKGAPLDFRLPPAEPVSLPTPQVPVAVRPWWKNGWWWLLPLLLLLLLLLLGLRGCIPGIAPHLPLFGTPQVDVPAGEPVQVPVVNGADVTGTVVGHGVTHTGGAVNGSAVAPVAGETGDADAAVAPGTEPAQPSAPAAEAPTPPGETPAAPTAQAPAPEPAQTPATPQAPGAGLSIPPAAADGAADFLNGQYRAGAGIQDVKTGKPLRLEYTFKDGKGDVTVHRANGVSCTGPVSAAMKGGSLSINSQGQAVCGDGSTYDMPKVNCRPGATRVADCAGAYGNDTFPMSMRHAGE